MRRGVVLLALLAGAGAGAACAELPPHRLVNAFPGLRFSRPVLLTHAGDDSGRLFVVEQRRARVMVFAGAPSAASAAVFLDLSRKVDASGQEMGLLALAFHPRFRINRELFVWYTAQRPLRNVLSRLRASPDLVSADPRSEQVLLEIEKPYHNHNGGSLLFGPDGMLYVSTGDGGSAGDPFGNGQDLRSLLGKVLRLDVDRTERGRRYAVPPDNPFVGQAGARGEVWAYGLRNPWRISFDRTTGELWAGDVGQDEWEEIDLIVKGGNYGWSLREGAQPFGKRGSGARPGLIDPVWEYPHDAGGPCVVGGHVYRGARLPALRGAYLYADYITGKVWALRRVEGEVVENREIVDQDENLASFGEGPDGEVYLCGFDGRIYRLEPSGR